MNRGSVHLQVKSYDELLKNFVVIGLIARDICVHHFMIIYVISCSTRCIFGGGRARSCGGITVFRVI